MKSEIKQLVKRFLYTAGYYNIYGRLNTPSEKRLLVLMYHDLIPDGARRGIKILDDDCPTRSHFAAHLRVLSNKYRVVPLSRAVEEIRSGNRLEQESVAITFDDGYASFYTAAYPLLRKYDLPATVFLATDWINNNTLYWWHRLRQMVSGSCFSGVTIARLEALLGLELEPMSTDLRFDVGYRRRFLKVVESHLRDVRDADRQKLLNQLEDLLFPHGDYVPQTEKALTWDQIREMAANRIEFEAHTHTHVNFRFADDDTVEHEIVRSKHEIEKHTQCAVTGFAYPYGMDLASYVGAEEILQKHGFQYACSAVSGNNSPSSNLYALRRNTLPSTTSAALIKRDLCLRFILHNAD